MGKKRYGWIGKKEEYKEKDAWHRVQTVGFPYFNLSDVKRIYKVLKGNTKGWSAFEQEAKEIALPKESEDCKYYQFTDETALFELFNKHLSLELKKKSIHSWGELMQYIS